MTHLTPEQFQQYENLRSRYLEEAKSAGFTGQDLTDIQFETISFIYRLLETKANPVAVTPPVVVPVINNLIQPQF